MLLSSTVRWELLRLGTGELGRAIAFDTRSTFRRRSGRQHLRNGLGALVSVAGDVGVHGSLPASIWLATRKPARAELDYALSELRRVRSGSGHASRSAAAVAVALALAAWVGVGWRVRSLSS
jgi:hypothetical protein